MEFSDLKFLVVDDSKLMRRQIEKTLQSLNAGSIVHAGNGAEALEVLGECLGDGDPVGFIISDVNMPEMNGIDLLKAVKKNGDFSGLPFVFVTAEGLEEDEENAKIADGVLRKPVKGEAIAAILTGFQKRKAS